MTKYFIASFLALSILLLFHTLYAQEMIQIPAGSFLMGESGEPGKAPKEVTLAEFYIDPVEVTNRDFRNIFPAHTYPSGADDHPVSLITWEEADAYCKKIEQAPHDRGGMGESRARNRWANLSMGEYAAANGGPSVDLGHDETKGGIQ